MNIKQVTLLFGVFSGSLLASAFQNGSFESPVMSSTLDFITVPTGWTKVDPSCSTSCIGLFMQQDTKFGIPFVPANGHQSFGFGGNGVTSGSLSQTFDTVVGGIYSVSYQYLIQQGSEQEALEVDALNGGTTLATNAFLFSNTSWTTGTLQFTATGTSSTLKFSDNTGSALPGVGVSTNWALDAVTVTQTNATPEPASFVLAGLGAVMVVLRRRRAKV
jgi:Protein of unknown function (DUF642)/PEP-CTERM motif